jgi:hypothetical protein
MFLLLDSKPKLESLNNIFEQIQFSSLGKQVELFENLTSRMKF